MSRVTGAESGVDARARAITERVARVRALMQEQRLDQVLCRSTDRYLNEYVPKEESTRLWLTGFTGSMGEALVARDQAWVCVDGRYYLQADLETAGTPFQVDKVPLGTPLRLALFRRARALAEAGARRIGYEPDRFTVAELEELERHLAGSGAELVPTLPSLPELARGPIPAPRRPIRAIDPRRVGRTVREKLALVRPALEQAGVAALLVQRLDELAYAANLRGGDFPFQATFRGLGLVCPERLLLVADPALLPPVREPGLEVVDEASWTAALPAGARVGYDPAGATPAALQQLRAAGLEPVVLASPLQELKAKKTPEELAAMRQAFARADAVVEQAVAFVQERIDQGQRVTELDLAEAVERLFLASGATGLSFRVIAAAGQNGAHIHYSHPDPERAIAAGELVLLDTGAYYEEGYATDLTRTFLAGSRATPSADQRRYFTLVLKAAIAGMSARVPVGARGEQLDAITRAPMWAEALDYNHGTGHGVGINVHEAPPRVSTTGAPRLEVGQVFSIEPGVYLPEFGGVRIENLCTLVESPGHPGFLDVVPLTNAAVDERLVDEALLTPAERAWLAGWRAQRERRLAGAGTSG